MRSIVVTLGGVSYTVNQLPMRPEAEWRGQLRAELGPLLTLMEGNKSIEFDNPADIAAFLGGLAPTLIDAPDIMLRLLFGYSPELARHADAIANASYSDEVFGAFKGVLGLALPFAGELAKFGPGLAGNGAAPKPSPTM